MSSPEETTGTPETWEEYLIAAEIFYAAPDTATRSELRAAISAAVLEHRAGGVC